MYIKEDFLRFVEKLKVAETPSDVLSAWTLLDSGYNSLTVVSALENYNQLIEFPGINIRGLDGSKLFTPMFLNSSLYFSSRNIINGTLKEERVDIPIDSSIMFDTNFASYIDAYIKKRGLGKQQAEIVHLIHELMNSNANYDYLYYLIENVKQFVVDNEVVKFESSEEFWNSLNSRFKSNLISLRLFNSIDCVKFKRNGCTTPSISYSKAEEEAKTHTFNFYFGNNESDWISNDVLRRLLVAKVFIYKALIVYFESGEGLRKKTSKYLDFMIRDVGAFFEREMMMVIRFFEEGKSFKFFEKVDKGKHIPVKRTLSNVENMAWDMVYPRLVEFFSLHLGEGKPFIPYMLTWDKGLRQALEMHKAKAMIYDSDKAAVILLPEKKAIEKLESIVGRSLIEKYFNKNVVSERYNTKPPSLDELIEMEKKLERRCIEVLH